MKDYFYLQYIMTNRKIKEAGLPPLLGYLFVLIAFVLLSAYVFQKTDFAKYLVILISLSSIFKLSENTRADFLLSTFGDKIKMQIRILENSILCLPFVLLLLYKSCFLEASMLFLCSLLLSLFTLQSAFHFTIPTPFSNNPFEFSTGFRKSFFLFPIAYALTFMAIKVDNFNLGLFSMLLIFLIAMSYYPTPENEFFVWVHADSPRSFLKKKMMVVINLGAIVSSKLGETSKNLSKIFKKAAIEDCIIFLDEFDSLGKVRDYSQDHGEMKRVVNTILQLFDYLPQSSIVIAATNQKDMLDEALIRRFDNIVEFKLPNEKEIQELIALTLKNGIFSFDKKNISNKIIKECFGLSYYSIQKTLITAIKRSLFATKEPEKTLSGKIDTQIWKDLVEAEKQALNK
jgi:hypothetical protein